MGGNAHWEQVARSQMLQLTPMGVGATLMARGATTLQPGPREGAHSACTPGLADGQGCGRAVRLQP